MISMGAKLGAANGLLFDVGVRVESLACLFFTSKNPSPALLFLRNAYTHLHLLELPTHQFDIH
jgi:hypothetical protein